MKQLLERLWSIFEEPLLEITQLSEEAIIRRLSRWYYDESLFSIFEKSLLEAIEQREEAIIGIHRLEKLFSYLPFSLPLPTIVHSETGSFFGCETKPLSPP